MPEASEGLYYLNLDDVLGLYCEVFGCPLEVATERLRSLQGHVLSSGVRVSGVIRAFESFTLRFQ